MDGVLAIDFPDALAQLQALLGHEVRAFVNLHDSFGGCVIEGELARIETLPPDAEAIRLVIAERQSIVLDPLDVDALLVGDPASGEGAIEFHLASRGVVRLERASTEPPFSYNVGLSSMQ